MFKVEVNSSEDYFNFDLQRKSDLLQFDQLIKEVAPDLNAYFHAGTPIGASGMRVKLLGYGETFYLDRKARKVEWPMIGVALQKNYISVYIWSEVPIDDYIGKLGECKVGKKNNFSFRNFSDLKLDELRKLLLEVEKYYKK
ncbi:DUF1801 domain-containing protein [Lactococcus protaetiae]|uniref:DUF1801 domain-containing protein n=1 Tax=Lactococcus protaetiae TaxID=2592653 RepID=A0A514ZB31_9LACT|nr:DUF1801 domain-containing protein [Lactococcus protaetiae]QDK71796.1 DUF1801 domain-containing protein [Lactococcus protaetiae]